jgi:hypothetical protein
MKKFIVREILPEFKGMKDVIKKTHTDGTVLYHTHEYPFTDEAWARGACKLNVVDNEFGHYMHLFNSKNETVGVYKMTSRLRGFTIQQLAEQKAKLFCCKMFNQEKDIWETYVDGTPAKVSSYKEGCGLATILNDGHYYVVDKENNYIVPPGRYDYIDGFDKCGLARVKIDEKVDFIDPSKSTKDRLGIIDIDGKEVLPLVYSEIWGFYNKDRRTTKVVELEHKISGDGDPYIIKTIYEFRLFSKKLVETGYWINDEYFEAIDDNDLSDQYSIWDALDGEPDVAGNIDYEW